MYTEKSTDSEGTLENTLADNCWEALNISLWKISFSEEFVQKQAHMKLVIIKYVK